MTAPAWEELTGDPDVKIWERFEVEFDSYPTLRRPGPAIIEPRPSVTVDLSPLFDSSASTFAAGRAAVNAVALLAMTQAFAAAERLIVLDWQHPDYWFWPHRQATGDDQVWPVRQVWPVDVFPDGDFHVFLTEDMTEGTFGHPWEQTLCSFGPRLMPKLEPLLTSWLPVKRSRN